MSILIYGCLNKHIIFRFSDVFTLQTSSTSALAAILDAFMVLCPYPHINKLSIITTLCQWLPI